MIAFLAGLYIACFLGLAIWFARTEGYVSLVVVFGITGFYYYLAVPLELWYREEPYVWNSGLSYAVPHGVQLTIAVMALLALLSFAMGLHCSGFRVTPARRPLTTTPVRVPRSILFLGLLPAGVVLIGYGRAALGGLADYYEGHAIRHDNPTLSASIQFLLLSMAVVAGTLLHGSRSARVAAWSLVAAVAWWGFYSQDKNPLVQACLCVAARYVGQSSRGVRFLVLACLAAFLTIGGLPLFSAYRGGAGLDVSRLWRDFSVLDTDAAGPLMSLAITTARDSEWRLGQTYLRSVALLVPRSLWPDRPPSLAEQFAMDNMPPERWFAGAGYGYSLMAEAYVNFGILGAVIQYFAAGWLLGRVWRWTLYRFGEENRAYWNALYVCSAFMCVVLMHRGASNHIARNIMYYTVVPWLLFAMLDSRMAAWGRRSLRRTRASRRNLPNARTLDPQFPA